jgi:hypothetical protein
MNKFIDYATVIHTYAGSVAPKHGSLLAQAVDVVTPNQPEVESDTISEGLENAIQQTLVDFSGGYGDITEEMINELVAISSKRLTFMQNVVAPITGTFSERVGNMLENNLDSVSILDFDIKEHGLVAIAEDARFQELCQSYVDAEGFGNVALAPNGYLLEDTEETLMLTVESGIEDWDAKVKDVLVALGEEGMSAAFNRLFRNSNRLSFNEQQNAQVISYANDLNELNTYIAMFLFLNSVVIGGYAREDELRAGKHNVKTVMRKNAAALASTILTIIRLYKKDASEGTVIFNIQNHNNVITVYRDNFQDFIANGGEVETIKMAALLAYDGKPKYSKASSEELLAVTREATEMFDNRITDIEVKARDEALSRSKHSVSTIFTELLESKSELELGITNRDELIKGHSMTHYFADITNEEFADRPRELAIEAFCHCVYPKSSFIGFLRKMNDVAKLDSTVSTRHAAYRAFVSELVANLLTNVTKQGG